MEYDNCLNPITDKKGVVFVMVLIFMLATMTVGITVMRSTITETKIVGNERDYNQDFYLVESAAEIIIPQFDDIVSVQTWDKNSRTDVSDKIPNTSIINGANVGMTLVRTGSHTGSGSSAANTVSYYFKIDSSINNQSLDMGVWKVFPTPE